MSRPQFTLQMRFTLVAAGAVAATALAITAVAFLAIRSDLNSQVQNELATHAVSVLHLVHRMHKPIRAGWVPPNSDRFGANAPYTQVITASGGVWTPPGGRGVLNPTPSEFAVAAGTQPGSYLDTKVGGVHAMLYTTPLAPGLALQLAEPLSTTDAEVAVVGTTLAVLSAIGVILATALGWAVARAGLRPVARLATVAEQVSVTGNPGRRVQVERPDEVGRLAMSFNRMLSALQRSLAVQRRLVSDASHELRTPLASLRVNVELLADTPGMSAGERKEVLNRVVDQVTELSQLVSSVTELARGESPHEAREDIRLDGVAATALEAARRDWPATEFQARLEGCVVTGSAERLRTAIKNLLDNAAKFGPPGSPVEVTLARGQLSVRDHGPGIDPADLPHVFDRFYRALSARAVPGSGLGLSVVQEIAANHGGTVEALAAPGAGTLMRLTLPARSPHRNPSPPPP
jgi:two-component system sensor histidine kinase MprB